MLCHILRLFVSIIFLIFLYFLIYLYLSKSFFVLYIEKGALLMNKKELLEQNVNIFLENYIADLLLYYMKNDTHISDLIAKKKKLYSQLTSLNAFWDYDEIQNEMLHTIAVLFYRNGFQDAIQLQNKLK